MILIDTHVWIWACESPSHLTDEQRSLLMDPAEPIWISAISVWEAAMLCYRGKIDGVTEPRRWIEKMMGFAELSVVELTPDIACESNQLPERFQRDPADRLIVATARLMNCPLLTSDRKIRDYPHVISIH